MKKAFAPLRFIIPEYLVEGLTIFAGRPKTRKSFLWLHAAVAISAGLKTLGIDCGPRGDVLYCALEDSERRLKWRIKKMFGTPSPDVSGLTFWTKMPRLSEGGADMIKQWIEQTERPRLIIVDTFAKIKAPKGREQSAYDHDYETISELQALALKLRIAIVLIHHTRKQIADDPFDTVSGTLGLTGAADTITILSKHSSGNYLMMAKGRDIEDYNKIISFDNATCVWSVIGDMEEGDELPDTQRLILRTLKDHAPAALSPQSVVKATDLSHDNVRQALARMAQTGAVKKIGHGSYTIP